MGIPALLTSIVGFSGAGNETIGFVFMGAITGMLWLIGSLAKYLSEQEKHTDDDEQEETT